MWICRAKTFECFGDQRSSGGSFKGSTHVDYLQPSICITRLYLYGHSVSDLISYFSMDSQYFVAQPVDFTRRNTIDLIVKINLLIYSTDFVKGT